VLLEEVGIDVKEPEKKTPLTPVNTMRHSAKVEFLSDIHFMAQLALHSTPRNCFDGIKEVFTLSCVLDVGINE